MYNIQEPGHQGCTNTYFWFTSSVDENGEVAECVKSDHNLYTVYHRSEGGEVSFIDHKSNKSDAMLVVAVMNTEEKEDE